jgi:hypothetical protein
VVAIGGVDPATNSPYRVDARLTHEPRHPLAGTRHARLLQRRMDPRAALQAPAVLVDAANLSEQFLIALLTGIRPPT